jgi:hypothetical protein
MQIQQKPATPTNALICTVAHKGDGDSSGSPTNMPFPGFLNFPLYLEAAVFPVTITLHAFSRGP